jgi:hypothetical protein
LNKKERFWEAQKIFTILIPVLSPKKAEEVFQTYCDSLRQYPRTDATAMAELAAINVYLSSISGVMSQNEHEGISS